MKPVKFKGSNVTFAEDQSEYMPLPAHIDKDKGIVTACWELSLKERVKLLFTGKLWQRIMTFNRPLQPQLLSCDSPIHNPGK